MQKCSQVTSAHDLLGTVMGLLLATGFIEIKNKGSYDANILSFCDYIFSNMALKVIDVDQ